MISEKSLLQEKPLYYLLAVYFIILVVFLVINPGTVFNTDKYVEKYGELVKTWGSRDAILYVEMADRLLTKGIYGYNANVSNASVTPGQPFYLAMILSIARLVSLSEVYAVRIANLLLSLALFVPFYLIGLVVKGRRFAIISSVVFFLFFDVFYFFRTSLTETPAIMLFYISVLFFILAYLTEKRKYYLLFGLSFGLLIMFRASPFPLLVIPAFLLLRKFRFSGACKRGLIIAIFPILLFLPWGIRNQMLFGNSYLLSSHGGNPFIAGLIPPSVASYNEVLSDFKQSGMGEIDFGISKLRNGFTEEPMVFAKWFLFDKPVLLYHRPDSATLYDLKTFEIMKRIHQVIVSLGIVGIFIVVAKKDKELWFIPSILIVYTLFSIAFLCIPRYGFLMVPCFIWLATYSLMFGASLIKKIVDGSNLI